MVGREVDKIRTLTSEVPTFCVGRTQQHSYLSCFSATPQESGLLICSIGSNASDGVHWALLVARSGSTDCVKRGHEIGRRP